jgi:hypothetical protein
MMSGLLRMGSESVRIGASKYSGNLHWTKRRRRPWRIVLRYAAAHRDGYICGREN